MTTRLLPWAVFLLATSVSVAQSADLSPEARSSAARMAVGTCGGCHGAQGASIVPKFPNLAAQPANYLAAQLKAFRSRSRGDPDALGFMWGMAASLDDSQIDALAQYYSAKRAPTGASGDAALRARGKTLYEHGLASGNVPPCGACHGSSGEGKEEFPRLAGQHAEYFMNQMRSFKANSRRTDPMRLFASALNTPDLEALAAYVQSL